MSKLFAASERTNAVVRARRMRRGLLLSGVAGLALFSGTMPIHAQVLAGSATPKTSSTSAHDLLNRARIQEAAGSLGLAASQYRDALAAAPGDVSVARELARFYSRNNRVEDASLAWMRVLQLNTGDAEATREIARLARIMPAVAQMKGTGVGNVAPLPPATGLKPQTRSVAETSAPRIAQTPPVGEAPASPVSSLPAPSPARSAAPVTTAPAPALAPLPPSVQVSPAPFTLPARRAVSVSDKNRIAAFPYVNRAASLLENKQTNRALLEYQRAAQLDPTNQYALPGVATSQLILGRFDEAAATYRRYLEVAPANQQAKALRGLADALTYGRRYREALGVNSYILSKTSRNFDAALQNAQIYTYLRSYNNANTAFQRAISLAPEDKGTKAKAWTSYGEALSYRRDPRAVQAFRNALDLQPGNPRATLGLGNYYLYSGQFNSAIPLLRQAAQNQKSNADAQVSLGDALTFGGQPAEALTYYSRALALQPNNAKASLGQGRALVYAGRYVEGSRILNRIVAADPKNTTALESLALAQAQAKSPNAARSYARLLALQTAPADKARTLSNIGDLQLTENNIPAATQSYAQAAQLTPSDVKINLTYAQLLSYGKQWAPSAAAARRVLAIDPNNAQAKVVLLQASQQPEVNDSATATQLATELQNATPATAEESLSLAQALRDAGNNEAASRLLLRAATQVKDPVTALRLADATRDAGDYPTAIALYQRLIAVQPNNVEARRGLVTTLVWSNNLTEAQNQVQGLVTAAPNDRDVQVLAAQIQLRLGTSESRDNAARIANQILAADPANADARAILGEALSSRQRYADAVQQLQAAVNAQPNNLEARLGLARNLNYSRDIEGSIAQYRELIRLAPADVTPRLELAQILLDRSRYAEAEALYNEVLVMKRGTALLPDVRRAVATNSLRRLPAIALGNSLSVRSAALVRPRASKHRSVVENPAVASKKRVLLAQNPTISGPTTPAAPLAPGTPPTEAPPTEAPPVTTPPTEAPPTEAPPTTTPPATTPPTEAPPTEAPATTPPTTVPSTPLPGMTNGTTTAPPLQPGATTPANPSITPAPTGTGPSLDTASATDAQVAALRGLGESRRRQNQFSDASNYFTQALALNPSDVASRVGLAQTLRSQNQFDAAAQQVQQALSIQSDNIPALVLQAQLLGDTGKTDEAKTQLGNLVSSLPADAPLESYTQLALALNSVDNYSASVDLLNRAVQQYPNEPSIARLRAETLGFAGQNDAAIAAYDQLLQTDPNDIDAAIGKARVYNYANRLPEAETAYRQALQIASGNATAQGELADVLGRRGNYTESITLYQSAINANPSDLALRVNLARLQRSAGQASDAEATLNQVLDADPNNVDALTERGLIRGSNGSYAAGLADLNRVLSVAPNNQRAQLGVAQIQSYSGNYADAITGYQAYLTRNPNDAQARVELAQTLAYANRSPEALTELDTVLSANPNDTRALLARAEIYARTNRPADAITIYNTLLSQDPQNTRAKIGLADAQLYARDYTAAVATYDQILQTDPNNTAVRVSRARALSYAGRFQDAVTALRAVVSADPTNVPARLALAEAGANSGNATLQRDAISEYRSILKDNPDNLNAQLGLARVLSYRGNYGESTSILNAVLKTNPNSADARLALADTQRFSGKPFDAKKNYKLAGNVPGLTATQIASVKTGLSSVRRATSPSIGVGGSYYDDTNGVRLRSVNESAYIRTKALTIGVLAEQGRFHQGNLAERNRTNYGILLARQFGPFAAQLIVSRLKYSGVNEKTLFNASISRNFTPRKRFNLSYSRRDIFESDLAVSRGITANILNLTGTFPLTKRFDLDGTATYYDYSDDNSRVTLSPALMFRFSPKNPSLRVGVGYTYDNTDNTRNAPFVYYTPQNFNAAAILADYIVTTGKTQYGLSGAVALTGSTGQNGINRPADTLFGFLRRDLGSNFDFNIQGGIVRVPNGTFRSNQVSGGLNYNF